MRFSASVSLMFQEHPLLDRFAAARDAGFQGVEIQRLEEGDPVLMARAARRAGVDVVLLNVPAADYSEGGPGLSGVPGRERAFETALGTALAAADILRARFVHLAPSRVSEGESREACLATYRRNLGLAVERARGSGSALLIEAMNRVEAPTALLNDLDDAAALILPDFAGQIGLQFDVYHTAMNGRDVLGAFTAHRELVRHVQFADAPGRNEPGTGSIDFDTLLPGLEAAGYSGWFGAEYRPSRATTATLGWMGRLAGWGAR